MITALVIAGALGVVWLVALTSSVNALSERIAKLEQGTSDLEDRIGEVESPTAYDEDFDEDEI